MLVLSVGAAAAVAAATSVGATTLAGIGVPWVCAAVAFCVQWVAFVPAYVARTEHFYDLVGSVTYLAVITLAFVTGEQQGRAILLAVLVATWALRLGIFLFLRIRRAGADRRFDEIKQSWSRFLIAWTLQGLWVFLTAIAAITALCAADPSPTGWLDLVGTIIWIVGFGIEVAADRQKSAFRRRNTDGFVSEGLWAWSRHPNYFGEILLWFGIAVLALSDLTGWQLVALVSPAFVSLLLLKISGVPMLEARADERWGDDPAYQDYRRRTPILIPRPPRREISA